jgi:hypothetical protein
MLYAGWRENYPVGALKIGYAFSSDGVHWTRHPHNPVIETPDDNAYYAPFILDGSTFFVWYAHGYLPDFVSYAWSECCAGVFGDDFETGDTSLWSVTVP